MRRIGRAVLDGTPVSVVFNGLSGGQHLIRERDGTARSVQTPTDSSPWVVELQTHGPLSVGVAFLLAPKGSAHARAAEYRSPCHPRLTERRVRVLTLVIRSGRAHARGVSVTFEFYRRRRAMEGFC